MKTISIAMATYNGAQYLPEQLASICAQDVLPMELVVCDDGSTDESLTILESFKAPFPIRIHRNAENLGYRGNFMKAASLCRGDLIAFCDQDDVWLPNKLGKCRDMIEDSNLIMAYHEAVVTDENLRPTGLLYGPRKPIIEPLTWLPRQFGFGFTFVIDRTLLKFNEYWKYSNDVYRPNLIESHDNWFIFLALSLGRVGYISHPLALYRRHTKTESALGYRFGFTRQLKVLLGSDLTALKVREGHLATHALALENAPEEMKHAAQIAAAKFRQAELNCRLRSEIYSGGNKLKKLISVYKNGGYGPIDQLGNGKKALIRDIISGLVLR